LLREDERFRETLSAYVYIHMFRDQDREAYAAWSRRHKAPVHAIPQINIVKPDGKLDFSQSGRFRDLNQTLTYKAKEISGNKEAAETVAEFKTALSDANGLIDDGKFVTAYLKLLEFPEGMSLDEPTTRRVRATVKRVEEAAVKKIAEAKQLVEQGKDEVERLDGAYQLQVIWSGLKYLESVRSKAHAAVNALGEVPTNKDLLRQAASLSRAKEAARNNDITKAREIYGKVLNEFKGSEAAKRAQARLEELDAK
jgi:hypothetical protein